MFLIWSFRLQSATTQDSWSGNESKEVAFVQVGAPRSF
ncbi:hypothetical protein OH687_36455 [Burkholderia anthina]|nr:hypothetical protein OH687_36455 [Burkholderia anthina]